MKPFNQLSTSAFDLQPRGKISFYIHCPPLMSGPPIPPLENSYLPYPNPDFKNLNCPLTLEIFSTGSRDLFWIWSTNQLVWRTLPMAKTDPFWDRRHVIRPPQHNKSQHPRNAATIELREKQNSKPIGASAQKWHAATWEPLCADFWILALPSSTFSSLA